MQLVLLEALPTSRTPTSSTTTSEVLDVVEEVDSPSVRMVLDVKSMSAEQHPIDELVLSASKHLAYFQADDANRRGPGFSDTDFVPIFRALNRYVGYNSYICVEAFEAPRLQH